MTTQADVLGRWRFVLRPDDGTEPLVVEDVEPDVQGERLELLSVVRGLEALDQPSRVVLMTPSVYVREGIRYGLEEWRANGWQWEWFGRMAPVKNADLWQRIDRAMSYHEVDCRTWRFDPPHEHIAPPSTMADDQEVKTNDRAAPAKKSGFAARFRPQLRRLWTWSGRRVAESLRELGRAACV